MGFGRREILTDETSITKDNVLDVLRQAEIVHCMNRDEMVRLLKYEKGEQPILSRVKEYRPNINIKISDNKAHQVTKFKVDYEHGNPITYVQKTNDDLNSDVDNKSISKLNRMMIEEDKHAKDIQLARYVKVCGIGYRMIVPREKILFTSPFKIIIPSPLNTFVIKSNSAEREPVMSVTYVEKINLIGDNYSIAGGNKKYTCYTKNACFEIDGDRVSEPIPNLLGVNVITEVINDFDLMGCFEHVMSEIDALNIVESDRVNDIVQNVQNLVWGHNIDIDEETKDGFYNGMWLLTKNTIGGADAKIQFLSKALDQNGLQTVVDSLSNDIMEKCDIPSRGGSSGGNTANANTLSEGWQAAETAAKKAEALWNKAEYASLGVILKIFQNSDEVDSEMSDLKLTDIGIEANRQRTYDLATMANSIATMQNLGWHPLRILERVPFFKDNQQAYNDSSDTLVIGKKNNETEEIKIAKLQPDLSDQPDAVITEN